MTDKLSVNFKRRIATSGWIIKTRWIYMVGILLIGLLTKTISESNVEFSFAAMVWLFVSFAAINLGLYFCQKRLEKNFSKKLLALISYTQIFIELVFFTIIMHSAGGVESISSVFFFLPVVSASLIFGSLGSIITALAAGASINLLIIAEYYGVISHINRYGVPTLEYLNLSIALTKTITTAIFYVIIGSFSGYGANMLFKREKSLEEKTEQMEKEKRLRQDELIKLDKTAKLLAKRDLELTSLNEALNEKVEELEDSDKSLSKTFKDLGIAKERAESEKEKTMALISNFSAPIIFLNNRNRLALFNPSAKEYLGVVDADLGVKVDNSKNFSLNNFANVVHNEFSVENLADEPDGTKLEEATIKYKNENRVYKIITSKVLEKNGNFLGIMKIFYDTTREKAIDKMKSEFISIAAHQLRTPLSAIKWIIKMILDGDAGNLSIEQQELLNKGYLSNERIIKLVNDLLNVSRIEEGKFGFNFEKVNFLEVLDTALENVESLVIKNHQKLTVEKPTRLPKIFLDKERMVMVMQNLLGNAIKYTPEYGKIQVIVKVDKQYLHVKINDQGVGIPAEDQPKLFSKFFRAANVVKLETEGTGLGLFMVKNIIGKHNGKISLKSEEGKGTEISFSIPINKLSNL